MSSIKRLICALLAAAMAAVAFASCAEKADDNDAAGDNDDSSVLVDEETETDRAHYKDSLPDDLHFEGETYRLLCRGDYFDDEFYIEELTGDVVDDAVYNRNQYITDKYNVKYEAICRGESADYGSELKRIRTDVSSGDDAYEAIAGYSVHVVTLLTEGLFMDINELDYLDFSQPWWPESVINEMVIGGKLFYITGDICVTALSKAECFYYNKTMAEQFSIPDIYSIVSNGEWTWDRFLELSGDIYQDVNGDGKQDDEDLYGIAITAYNNVDSMMAAFHVNVTENDEEGHPQFVLNNEKTIHLMELAYKTIYDTFGSHNPKNSLEDMSTVYKMFKADRALFIMWELTACDTLRDMESDYGIIPYPKYDENQNGYGSYVQDGHSLICIPVTNMHPELTGAMTEALAAESYRKVTPAYFETALQSKYARDEESIAMLDLVRSSIKYNFGYVYCLNAFYSTRTLMNTGAGSTDFASYYQRNIKSWQRSLDKMIEKFDETYSG